MFSKLLLVCAVGLSATVNALVLPNICKGAGQTALTFDMGPIKGVTETILNVLKAKNVKATFHVTTSLLDEDFQLQTLLSQIVMEGHHIGLSVDQRSKYLSMSNEDLTDYFSKSVNIIQKYSGKTPKFIRLLYEAYDDRIIQTLVKSGFYPTSFIDSYDYLFPNDPKGLQGYLNITYTANALIGSQRIFKFMDTPQTATVLPDFIDKLISAKLQISPLNECLKEGAYFSGKLDNPFQYNNDKGEVINVDSGDSQTSQRPLPTGSSTTASSGGETNYNGFIILISTILAITFQWL